MTLKSYSLRRPRTLSTTTGIPHCFGFNSACPGKHGNTKHEPKHRLVFSSSRSWMQRPGKLGPQVTSGRRSRHSRQPDAPGGRRTRNSKQPRLRSRFAIWCLVAAPNPSRWRPGANDPAWAWHFVWHGPARCCRSRRGLAICHRGVMGCGIAGPLSRALNFSTRQLPPLTAARAPDRRQVASADRTSGASSFVPRVPLQPDCMAAPYGRRGRVATPCSQAMRSDEYLYTPRVLCYD